jgi:catechol 2,3-dioxygenase-like lactoylglutathione lyase family enzyme
LKANAMQLSTARIFVRDLAQAQRFYGSSLGLPLIASSPQHGYSVFNAGALQLVLESVTSDAPSEEQALVGRFTGLSFTVANVHEKFQALVAAGVAFSEAPEPQAWGGILATFKDPDGNELQIVQLPN